MEGLSDSVGPSATDPDHASASVLDRYCFILNFGHATGASLQSHNVHLQRRLIRIGLGLALLADSRKMLGGVFGYVMLAHTGDRGAVRHSCFSILRIVARLGSQCSSERDQNWSFGTN